jgi:hypothetical protein
MSLQQFTDVIQGSDTWYDERRGLVTASVIGQLITPKTIKPAANDYSRGLTALLVSERITGWTEPTYESFDMQRGKMDEPIARDIYSKHYAPAIEAGFMIRDDSGYKIGFSPDGLVGSDGLIEIKSRKPKAHLATILSGEVPIENVAQLQCGLLVSGRDWIDYVSFCGGLPLYVIRVLPDERWFEAIIEAVEMFEKAAEQMFDAYNKAVEGLPVTERVIYNEEMVV